MSHRLDTTYSSLNTTWLLILNSCKDPCLIMAFIICIRDGPDSWLESNVNFFKFPLAASAWAMLVVRWSFKLQLAALNSSTTVFFSSRALNSLIHWCVSKCWTLLRLTWFRYSSLDSIWSMMVPKSMSSIGGSSGKDLVSQLSNHFDTWFLECLQFLSDLYLELDQEMLPFLNPHHLSLIGNCHHHPLHYQNHM